MKSAKNLLLAGLAALVMAPLGCSKCHVCQNVGGPCGIYSTTGRQHGDQVSEGEGQIIMEGDGSQSAPPTITPMNSTQPAPGKTTSRSARDYR